MQTAHNFLGQAPAVADGTGCLNMDHHYTGPLAFPSPTGVATPAATPPEDDEQDAVMDDARLRIELRAALGEANRWQSCRGCSPAVGGWIGEIHPAPKRMRFGPADKMMAGWSPEENDSAVSTAASTPVLGPSGSPVLTPQPLSPTSLGGAEGYGRMSVTELRGQLLGQGSEEDDADIAVGWEKDELIAVLQEMDRICMPAMMSLKL